MKIPDETLPEIYAISAEVYENRMKLVQGAQMLEQLYNLNNGSARIYILVFKSLMDGKKFKRTLNANSMDFILQSIKYQYGIGQLKKALSALQQHIHYFEETHNMTMHKMRGVYKKYLQIKE